MTVAIDASSPAAVKLDSYFGQVDHLTTASFTPPAGSILLMAATFDTNSPADLAYPSTISGPVGSWNVSVMFNNWQSDDKNGGLVMFAWAPVTSSAACVVQANFSSRSDCEMKTYVLTGTNTANPVIAHATTNEFISSPTTYSYTASAAGSLGFFGWQDWQGTGNNTLTNATSDVSLVNYSDGNIWHQTTAATGMTSQSFALSGQTHESAFAYVEVLPVATVQGGGTGAGSSGGGTLVANTLQVKLNGVDVTQYFEQSTWTLNQDFGRQGDTATFYLVDDHTSTPGTAHVTPQAEQTFVVKDTTLGITLFGGVVTRPQWQFLGYGTDYWTLNVVSYTTYADSRVVSYSYQNSSMGYILQNLTANAAAGITTNHVVSGPNIASVSGQFEPLSKAWSKITQMASTATTYGWWVDGNADLWVADEAQAQSSGVTFTDRPTASHLNAEGHYDTSSTLAYVWDATSLANRIYTVGGNVSATQTDAWTSNGQRRSYALTYPLDTGAAVQPILKINGVTTVVSTTTTDPWYLAQDQATGLWSLKASDTTSSPTPPNGQPISLTYGYLITQVSIVQNTTSITQFSGGSNAGYFDGVVADQNLTTLAGTQQRGSHEVAEYAFPQEQVTFVTTEDWQGWCNVGQTIQFTNGSIPDSANSYALGITNKKFLLISIRAQGAQGGYRTCQMTAIRVS